ncbi:MAG: UvrB/UvrC motif-containing protein [candidate division WOR-3 bacterium]|nr:UvrB/UvrC motif-containing protein [candidate division WOR-3 bacterium]
MKVCDICQKNESSITITRVDKDGKSTEMHLCSKCALEKGIGEAGKVKLSVLEILAELKDKIKDEDRRLVCPKCGIAFADFKRLGRLGCENCYNAFSERLLPLIKRIHGSSKHIGRRPTDGDKDAKIKLEAKRLRDELKYAIAAEDYEKAARIRDKIKKTEKEPSG